MATFYGGIKLKIGIIGLGSMGKRRIRLLQDISRTFEIYGYDSLEERKNEAKQKYGIYTVDHINEIIENEKIGSVFICSSPSSHGEIAVQCLQNKKHIFSELNLINNNYSQIIELSKRNNKIAFLSSTFLYRKEIQWIKNRLNKNEIYQYYYQVGQYLPDWHPWESYKNFFVSDIKTNACREIMAIEFPWITEIFGKIKNLKVHKAKISTLEIKYPDNYNIILIHENGNVGNININIVKRKAERRLEIMNENILINWNGTPETLEEYEISNKKFSKINLYNEVIKNSENPAFIVEDAYKEEILTFLKSVREGKNYGLYNYEKDLNIINLIQEIENME